MASIFLVIAAVSISAVLFHWLYHLLTKSVTLPPGPFPLPILGNVHLFLFQEPDAIFKSLHRKYGGAVTIHIGHSLRQVIFMDAKLIGDIFEGHGTADIVAMRPKFPGIEGGVLWAPWPDAIEGRKYSLRCLESFGLSASAQKLATRGTIIQDEIAGFCSFLDSIVGQPMDIGEKVRECLASCVIVPLHGRRLDLADPRTRELFDQANLFFQSSIRKSILALFLPQLRHFDKHDMIHGAARMKQIFLEWVNEEIPKRNWSSDNRPTDFIDCYLQAKSRHQDDQMTKESFAQVLADLFLGAQDTTAQSSKLILFYLAKHPSWQRILQDELDSAVGENEVPNLTHKGKLVKLQAFIYEVLRHATFAQYVLSRVTKVDFSFTMNGQTYTVPKFSSVYYTIVVAHEDKAYWGDPEAFRPERWLTDEEPTKLKQHSSHFFPFGIGKRVCIGEQAARTIMFLFISSVLQRFNFRLAKDLPLDAHLQMINRNPPKFGLVFQRRC